jgi:hypothetical protein
MDHGRPGQKPQLQDFGTAVDTQESVIETLYNPAVKCNVIVTSHIQRQEDASVGGIQKGFPSAIGKKLPPKIGRYFNSIIQIKKSGMGANVKRELFTSATADIDLKVSKPSLVPAVLGPDLAGLFKLLKQVYFDIKSDVEFPNRFALRLPACNNTDYLGSIGRAQSACLPWPWQLRGSG